MRTIFILMLTFSQISCSEEKQYYTRHFHNQSGEELKNVVLYWDDGTNSRAEIGTMIDGATKNRGFNYIRPTEKPLLRWEDMDGNQYEQQLDLRGIFPTNFNGGHFHVVIKEGFDVNYTFGFLEEVDDSGNTVREPIVYSPENRTAQ